MSHDDVPPHETSARGERDLAERDAERELLVPGEHVEHQHRHLEGVGHDGLGLRIARLIHEA
jgi:hypothetical protein